MECQYHKFVTRYFNDKGIVIGVRIQLTNGLCVKMGNVPCDSCGKFEPQCNCMPYCEACGSCHPVPRDKDHHTALACQEPWVEPSSKNGGRCKPTNVIPPPPVPNIDPKGDAGKQKPQLHLVPTVALVECSKALKLGADKYGERNWANAKVKQSTYLSAMLRHWGEIQGGNDLDTESGAHHLGHIMANCAIILDAMKCGTLVDDRVLPGKATT